MILEEFDESREAVFNSWNIIRRVEKMPGIAVCCYSAVTFQRLVDEMDVEIIAHSSNANMVVPIFKTTYKNTEIALFMIQVGAPASASLLEDVFAMGVEQVVVFGTCGCLDSKLEDCSIIIPNRAVRDEGTSFHYAPPSEEIPVNPRYIDTFTDLLEELGWKYTVGKVWTTDGVYRETAKKVAERKASGCICVDMECSANAAVASFRQKEVFQFFYAADNLDAEEWDARSLGNHSNMEEKDRIAWLAMELAVRIADEKMSESGRTNAVADMSCPGAVSEKPVMSHPGTMTEMPDTFHPGTMTEKTGMSHSDVVSTEPEERRNYQDINARTIDRWIEEGWEWGQPVSHETYEAAQKGQWDVLLTPTKPVPHEWFGDLRGKKVLGLASGGGQQMPVFAALGAKCTVLDYSEKQLESERLVAEREGYEIRIIRADMTKPLPFADGEFDLIFHPVSNCYVEEVKPIFREAFRVLRHGGVLLAGFDNGVNYIFDDDEKMVVNTFPFNPLKNPEQMKQLLDSDGGVQFSHTLEEQIGGQLEAGFVLTSVYEDLNGSGNLHDHRIPTFWATRAVKP